MTKKEYKEYQDKVEDFFKKEGINCLSSKEDCEASFSWRSCDCCGESKGGNRVECAAYNPTEKEIFEYEVCEDCFYYCEYGQLDDQTMLEIEESEK